MQHLKILIAGCSNPTISTNIQTKLQNQNCKINTIGDLNNIMVSVALDKPDILCIHFHAFTHNALDIAKEINERYGIPSIFLIDSDSFKEAVEICEFNILGCLKLPFLESELEDIVELYRSSME